MLYFAALSRQVINNILILERAITLLRKIPTIITPNEDLMQSK